MSDTTWPDGPYLVTWPDNTQDAVLMVNGQRKDAFDTWTFHYAIEMLGAQFTPLVPATEPSVDEMLEQVRRHPDFSVLSTDDEGGCYIAMHDRNEIGFTLYYTGATAAEVIRAAWQAVCKEEK